MLAFGLELLSVNKATRGYSRDWLRYPFLKCIDYKVMSCFCIYFHNVILIGKLTVSFWCALSIVLQIRQNRELEDGSLDVVTHGQQRFHLQHRWIDAEGVVRLVFCLIFACRVYPFFFFPFDMGETDGDHPLLCQPWAAVQIIQEDKPLQIPKDAFGQLASVSNIRNRGYSHAILSAAALTKRQEYKDDENEWEHSSNTNTDSDYSMADMEVPRCSSDSCDEYGSTDESMSSDNELMCGLGHMSRKSQPCNSESECHPLIHDKMSESDDRSGLGSAKVSVQGRESVREWNKAAAEKSKWLHRAPRSFWPQWVYRMYDPYSLAWRLAGNWSYLFVCCIILCCRWLLKPRNCFENSPSWISLAKFWILNPMWHGNS